MLSFSRGRPIARISGGKYDGKVVYIYDPYEKKKQTDEKEITIEEDEGPCCKKCNEECEGECCKKCRGGCFDTEPDIEMEDPLSYIDTKKIAKSINLKKLSLADYDDLAKALTRKKIPVESKLSKMYKTAKKEIDTLSKNEMIIYDGTVIPLPMSGLKGQRDAQFYGGMSGSGKSTEIGKYVGEYKKLFPKRKVFLFSRKDEDPELDKHSPIRVKIDEELVEEPIQPKELKNSLVIFDDIDTIRDKKLKESVRELRDDIYETGRSENIYMAVSNHQLMDYKNTRTILNESNAVTFYPQNGSSYHIKRFLREYCGLAKKVIDKILSLPSRWVTINKTYPCYVIYDKGIFLLNKY